MVGKQRGFPNFWGLVGRLRGLLERFQDACIYKTFTKFTQSLHIGYYRYFNIFNF